MSPEGYVPYGWQFADEQISIPAQKGQGLHCFAFMSRGNQIIYRTCEQNITAAFVVEQLESLSLAFVKPTVVVLNNARIHTAAKLKERLAYWQQRGLFVFYPPPISRT